VTHSPDRYSRVAVALHWTIALAIVFQIILGWRMDDHSNSAVTYQVFQLHKSVGITVLLLSLARLGWRIANPPPPLPDHLKPWERTLAHLTHFGFYAIMIGLPVTGWIMVSASKTNIPTLLYGVVPWPHVPGVAELAPQAKLVWHKAGEIGHGALAKLTYLLLALHVGGALKHQLVDRDATLARMIPGVRGGAWVDPRAVVTALAVIGALVAGQLVFRGTKAPAAPPRPPETASAPVAPVASQPVSPPAAATSNGPVSVQTPHPVTHWTVEPGGTLEFATSWSGQPVTGQFRDWSADIRFSEDAPQDSSVTVTINPASVATGDSQRDATLPTDDWFDTSRFPSATFHAGAFRRSGSTYVADGEMRLKGVSHPLKLTFTLDIRGDRATAHGNTSIDRTVFGVGKGEFAATDQIPAAVQVRFSLKAHRQPSKTGKP
jgi:cytochrome b561/polyisoprenoid-binding protein YceI